MIGLYARDPFAAFGVASILDIEGIAYRRVDSLTDPWPGLLIVAASDLTVEETHLLRSRRSLVLVGGAAFAREAFGVDDPRLARRAVHIELDAPLWPARIREIAASFQIARLELPVAPACAPATATRGQVLAGARLPEQGGLEVPLAVQEGKCVWLPINLAAALADLLTEGYLPDAEHHRAPGRLPAMLAKAAFAAYYAAPDGLRQRVQKRAYGGLAGKLERLGAPASSFPIDGAGWLLIELFKAIVVAAQGYALIGLARWPEPYASAATLTHDVEPCRYAYTTGLERLLDAVGRSGHAATFGMVAQSTLRYLGGHNAERLGRHSVICHGLTHRGDPVSGDRPALVAQLQLARARLEQRLQREVDGYRNPRLDRSMDLLWALDRAGFAYDSSYPDVDRENAMRYGGGVRLNLPYRPPVADGGGIRASKCLELPLTAPDCIQPLFGGADESALRSIVARKSAFVQASESLYVALVHGGVFGDRDSEVRMRHLCYVRERLAQPGVWLASLAEIAAWWRCRESLRVEPLEREIVVRNHGSQAAEGIRLTIETAHGRELRPVETIPAGGETRLKLMASAQPAA